MVNLKTIEEQYFVRRARLRTLVDYVREVGVTTVFRKIVSRMGESLRNAKYMSVGVGRVMESDPTSGLPSGSMVAFIVASGPSWSERIVVHRAFCRRLAGSEARGRRVVYTIGKQDCPEIGGLLAVAGWDPEGGANAPSAAPDWLTVHSDWLSALHARTTGGLEFKLPVSTRTTTRTDADGARPLARREGKKSLAIVGFGNYVKTVALPELRRRLDVCRVYELDPLMIPAHRVSWEWEIGPGPKNGEELADAYLLAGYHHSHAPLAAQVLAVGRWSIIEKPIATTPTQLKVLRSAAQINSRIISCFQKRYDEFTSRAIEDLTGGEEQPISYSCVVYEVPLPRLHWYTWPSSGSRLLSNGCHWIDHFLWLNPRVDLSSLTVAAGAGGALHVWIELENRATFSMMLTEQGSDRLGLQDIVDLRAGLRTVRIRNSTHYEFESSGGTKSARQLRMAPYRRMYRQIAERIVQNGAGDDLDHTFRSAATVLRAEEEYNRVRAAKVHTSEF